MWHLGYSVNQHAFLGHRIKRGGFPRTHILASQTENRCRKVQNHKGGTEGEESCEAASRWLYEGGEIIQGNVLEKMNLELV